MTLHNLRDRKNTLPDPNFKWQGFINWPLECTAACCNDLSELVLMLGVDVNSPISLGLRFNVLGSHRQTILDAVHGVVTQMKKELDGMEKKSHGEDQGNGEKVEFEMLAEANGWKGVLGKRMLKITEDEDANQKTDIGVACSSSDDQDDLRRVIEYFMRLEEDLLSRGAKTWKELYPDEIPLPDYFYPTTIYGCYGEMNTSIPGFTKLSKTQSVAVPTHQIPFYEELFEACCSGDNAKIEELCLSKKGKVAQELIQITSRFGDDGWGKCMSSIAIFICTHFTR